MASLPTKNGKDTRFKKGNVANPQGRNGHSSKLAMWQSCLYAAATKVRVRHVMENLVTSAEGGEPWAIKELLDRCLGKPQQHVSVDAEHKHSYTLTVSLEDISPDTDPVQAPAALPPAASGDL